MIPRRHILSFGFLVVLWSPQARSYDVFPEITEKKKDYRIHAGRMFMFKIAS